MIGTVKDNMSVWFGSINKVKGIPLRSNSFQYELTAKFMTDLLNHTLHYRSAVDQGEKESHPHYDSHLVQSALFVGLRVVSSLVTCCRSSGSRGAGDWDSRRHAYAATVAAAAAAAAVATTLGCCRRLNRW